MRARNLKPGLFKNEILGTADPLLAILFEGLWCLADREGRLEDRPLRIKAEIFPYRENLDVNGYLTDLTRLEFIDRYQAGGQSLIQIINFGKHQNPHHTERKSTYPAPGASRLVNGEPTVSAPKTNRDTPADSLLLIPSSLIPEENRLHDALQSQRTVQTAAAGADDLVDAATGIFLRIPSKDGGDYNIHVKAIKDWEREFPAVNVRQEVRSTRGYWLARPINQRLGRHQIRQSLRKHLAKKQDCGRSDCFLDDGGGLRVSPAKRRRLGGR